jgi:hypothetical protein
MSVARNKARTNRGTRGNIAVKSSSQRTTLPPASD